MRGRLGSSPLKSRGSLPLVPACFAAGFNILIFASKYLSEMLLVSHQNQVMGCSSKPFTCASLESKAVVCLPSSAWPPVSGLTRLRGTDRVFIIIFMGIREKGHSVHPVCCTILMVTKALLRLPSALPSRGIQCSCKAAVLHFALRNRALLSASTVIYHLFFHLSFLLLLPLPLALYRQSSCWKTGSHFKMCHSLALSIYPENIKCKAAFPICHMKWKMTPVEWVQKGSTLLPWLQFHWKEWISPRALSTWQRPGSVDVLKQVCQSAMTALPTPHLK